MLFHEKSNQQIAILKQLTTDQEEREATTKSLIQEILHLMVRAAFPTVYHVAGHIWFAGHTFETTIDLTSLCKAYTNALSKNRLLRCTATLEKLTTCQNGSS